MHELAAKRTPSTLRNSALTRLLAPSLAGGAHVGMIVCSSAVPAISASRDALETLAFGEIAGRVSLDPRRKTDVGSEGQLGKLRAGLKLGVFKEAKGPSSPKPLPDGVDVSTPGIATAWLWFQELDGDKSGELDLAEIGMLP